MSIENVIYLIAYIIIYSFLGWILESIYKTIYCKRPVNSGFLLGPLCPIYGFGAAIMYLCLDNFKDNIILLFIAGVIIFSIWEYSVGFFLEKIFKTKYWDYTNNKFNLHGRICLFMSMVWGVLGVIFIKVLHPGIMEIVINIPKDILIELEMIAIILIVIDSIVTVARVTDINIGMEKLADITDTIKAKVDELKTLTGKANEKSREKVKAMIEELKQKQENLKLHVIKRTARLRLAFPSMKSEKITQLLNKKIDILGILKNDKK